MRKIDLLDIAYDSKKKKTRKEIFLEKMEAIIPFELCLELIRPYYYLNGNGRQPIPLETMFRMYLVSNWYNTSDEATEDLVIENHAVRRFVGLNIMSDSVPDETTLWNFRSLLEYHKLTEKIFEAINFRLEQSGILCKQGSIVDATLIAAPSSTRNKDKSRDPEMSSTKKNNNYVHGMKSGIGVDDQSGLVHTVVTKTAKVHDIEMAAELLHGEETRIGGDAGFIGLEKREDIIKKFGAEPVESLPAKPKKRGRQPKPKAVLSLKVQMAINRKRMKIAAMPDGEEKELLQAEEKAKSQIRAKVEYPFRYLKCVFGFRKTRVRGLERNHAKLVMMYALTNLYLLTSMGVILKQQQFLQDKSALLQKNGAENTK